MYGPAVRCKRFFLSGRYGLASMYPASAWSGLCSGPSWDQRACDLITGQASTGPFGSPVFACAGKTDLHRRLILSQTSAGRLIGSSIAPHFMAVPLFVPGGRSFVRAWRPFLRPDLRVQTRRAQGAVKVGRRAGLASRFRAARPRLDGPEHGARITLDGAPSHWSCRTRRRAPC
jgi:hypothetical protein